MKVIAENICPESNHAKEIVDLVFRNMMKGDIMVVYSRSDDYHIILMGDRENAEDSL